MTDDDFDAPLGDTTSPAPASDPVPGGDADSTDGERRRRHRRGRRRDGTDADSTDADGTDGGGRRRHRRDGPPT